MTCRLTGKIVRANSSLGYKCLWSKEYGYPSEQYLNQLRPGFARKFNSLLRGPVLCPGEPAGYLSKELADKYGLRKDTIIAIGTLDGHTSMAALGALDEEDATLVVGTSNVLPVQTKKLHEIPGICGVVSDGLI